MGTTKKGRKQNPCGNTNYIILKRGFLLVTSLLYLTMNKKYITLLRHAKKV